MRSVARPHRGSLCPPSAGVGSDSPEPLALVLCDACASRTGIQGRPRAPWGRLSPVPGVCPWGPWVPAMPRSGRLSSGGSGTGRSGELSRGQLSRAPGSDPGRRVWEPCVGSGSHVGRLGDGDPLKRGSVMCRCGCRPCREAGGCLPAARELAVPETSVFCPERSGGQLSRAAVLRSWATCMLAAPESGSRFVRVGDGDPRTRVSGHKQRGCRRCREAGGCRPNARVRAVPES